MSCIIKRNSISLTRGDTAKITLSLSTKASTEEDYIPEEGDSIRFAMKRKVSDSSPVLTKEIPTDTMLLQIDPDDTKNLEFGSYVYDIQVTFADGTVDTVIFSTLDLWEEVD